MSSAILMFPFCRLNANFSYKRKPCRTKTRPVFRDFSIKNLNLMEFIRKARTVPRCVLYEKAIKTDIYAVRFALLTLFSFKKRNFMQYASRLLQKRPIFHYGAARANAFFRIDLFLNNRGTVRAFEIN